MKIRIKKSLYPSTIVIFIFVTIIYYWNLLTQTGYITEKLLVYTSIICTMLGYFLFHKRSPYIINKQYNMKKMYKASLILISIGLLAHIYYYGEYLDVILKSYGASYEIGRGKGYITVFFELLPIGILFLFQSNTKIYSKKKDFIGIVLSIIYIIFYLFLLKKRRQIIFLIIGITVIRLKDFLVKHKFGFCISIIVAYIIFAILGQVRGYFVTHSLTETIEYIKQEISIDWFLISNLEGKYISMILNDIVNYVDFHGMNQSTLMGALLVFIPRSIFTLKPLAFPEWYTYNFHWNLYLKGHGYAGSLLGEIYLIGSWFAVIVVFIILGAMLNEVNKLLAKEQGIMYSIIIYIMTMIPRLDLGSLFIFFLFMYIPSKFIYSTCSETIIV